MASKGLVLLGLFAVLLIVSEVAVAAERQSGKVKSEETVQPDQDGRGGYNRNAYAGGGSHNRGGGFCRYGCCERVQIGCRTCCSYAGEAVQTHPGH